jgi:hypothetical protein
MMEGTAAPAERAGSLYEVDNVSDMGGRKAPTPPGNFLWAYPDLDITYRGFPKISVLT